MSGDYWSHLLGDRPQRARKWRVFWIVLAIDAAMMFILAPPGSTQSLADRDTTKFCTPTMRCAAWSVPHFDHQPDTRRYVLVTRTLRTDTRSLAVRLPSKYVGADNSTPTVTFDILFFIWPNLSAAGDMQNLRYRPCINNCGGRMLLRLSYEAEDSPPLAERAFNTFLEGPAPGSAEFIRRHPSFDFDIVLSSKMPGWTTMEATAFYKAPYPGHPSMIATCSNMTPFSVCTGVASSKATSGLTITATFEREDLAIFGDFQEKFFHMLDAGVVARAE